MKNYIFNKQSLKEFLTLMGVTIFVLSIFLQLFAPEKSDTFIEIAKQEYNSLSTSS